MRYLVVAQYSESFQEVSAELTACRLWPTSETKHTHTRAFRLECEGRCPGSERSIVA